MTRVYILYGTCLYLYDTVYFFMTRVPLRYALRHVFHLFITRVSRYLHTYNEHEILYRLRHYYTFVVVRHPLTRLLSAYVDKLFVQDATTLFYQRSVGRHIVRNYRRNASRESLQRGHDVTLEEFVRFVVNESDLSAYRQDAHWAPISQLCSPCHVRYDYVAKVESMQQDAVTLLNALKSRRAAGRVGDELNALPVMNSNSGRGAVGLEGLSEQQWQSVIKRYENDMQLFGYGVRGRSATCGSQERCC